ncbi:hypothetical protein AB0368_36315 [Actinoplanes sp. NPDC051475]|uniref:hypothetical protein n=1 Tax=Actinoplanes sp. NPDC051475 TaxID=3157225 RepID=UPI00344D09F8
MNDEVHRPKVVEAARLREPGPPPAWLRARAGQADQLAAKETLDVLRPAVDAGRRMGQEYDERNWSQAERGRYAGLLATARADRSRTAAAAVEHGRTTGPAPRGRGYVAAPRPVRTLRR